LSSNVHVASRRKYLVGGGFPAWISDALGIVFTSAEFVAWNVLGLLVVCVAAWSVSRHSHFRFIDIALATVVLGNVAARVLGSLVTWTYSPGLVTGVVVWTPLGWIRLRSAWGASKRKARRAGIYLGLLGLVMTVAADGHGSDRVRVDRFRT
jgi:hypothetical protein